jgi:hypothetical protein
VALDRSQIVRDDLPTARRGLDPEAVRAHLAAVADEVERLRAEAARPTAAGAASRRVETIVGAAEASAEEIERTAREDAERMRSEAALESRELVEEVQAAAADLRSRLGVLDHALAELAERVAGVAAAAPAPEPPAPAQAPVVKEPEPEPDPEPKPEPVASAPPAAAAPSADPEGARLVALELALSGSSREEADRYVAEHFDVPDRAALLDEVFATAGQ